MQSTVRCRLLFFAKTRELAGGISEAQVEVRPDIALAALLDQLSAAYNLAAIRQSIIVAVNEQYCEDPDQVLNLSEGDEIAIIPPISGG